MASGVDGDLELGADAVGGGHEQGVGVARGLEVEQGPEAAQRGFRAGTPGRGGQRLDGVHQGGAGVDIHPGGGVGQARVPLLRHVQLSTGGLRGRRRAGL
jgi:hypothetical protein